MIDPSAAVTGGGTVALVIACAYAGRLLLDYVRERRRGPIDATAGTVGNAAAANAVLLKSLEWLDAENERLRVENERLRTGKDS